MRNQKGNALMGIIVIIIVLLVAGVFFLNSYKADLLKSAEIKKQSVEQTANAEAALKAILDSTSTTSTSYTTSTEYLTPIKTSTSSKVSTSTYKKIEKK